VSSSGSTDEVPSNDNALTGGEVLDGDFVGGKVPENGRKFLQDEWNKLFFGWTSG